MSSWTIRGASGTPLALWDEGQGPVLLMVHGGTADHTRWATVLPLLSAGRRVVTMDRRGRGGSGDVDRYSIEQEYDDVVAVAEALSAEQDAPVDVVGHSYGAVCVLGAAARGASMGRVVLYEPPGPGTAPPALTEHVAQLLEQGREDDALTFFLREVVGAPAQAVQAMRATPVWSARLAAVRTMPREGRALEQVDLLALARRVTSPVLLLLGDASPPWAAAVLEPLHDALPDSRLVVLPGQGHMAHDTAPELFRDEVLSFLNSPIPV